MHACISVYMPMRCSVLWCVVVCCGVLQYVVACFRVF